MGRYSGTLANLVEEAIAAAKPARNKNSSSSSRASAQNLWNKVLHYLESHSTTDGAIERPEFESPLPPFSVPSEILDEQLLERKFGPRQDNTILKLAVTAAPAPVVAALCHLQPHAARIPDHRGKLPLHVACRRNPNDADTLRIFEILLAVYVEALAHRDSAGRTPLHCLFMYHHGPHRTVETVQQFCQPLPSKLIEGLKQPQPHSNNTALGAVNTQKDHHHDLEDYPLPEVPNPSDKNKVPSNAAIIPDARHGCLPLHYAVMEGAPRDILRFLLQAYPESKRLVDRKGRTALSWYLGAGQCTTVTASGAGVKLLVTGEPTDPHSISWWDKNKIESATVQLLLNSKSARIADATGRSPLHWAICTMARNHYYQQHPQLKQQGPSVSMKTIQFLMDHYMEGLVVGDLQDKTPLHLLFDSIKEVQETEWKRLMRNKAERNDLDLKSGGRKVVADKTLSVLEAATAALSKHKKESTNEKRGNRGNFAPPMELLEILVSNCVSTGMDGVGTPTNGMMEDRSAVFMEDNEGRLPIHCAMEVASSADVIKLLIKAHPTSLVHTTEETLVCPLHSAVLSPFVAPLQTPETMQLILRAYVASRHGTYVDGRLALKMEDADGLYPIHYACKNGACLEILQMFVEEYPKCALFQTPEGNLPLHCLLDKHVFEGQPDGMPALGASLANSNTWSSPEEEEFHQERLTVLQEKMHLLVDPILNSNKVLLYLNTPSFDHGMLPLHIVVAWGAASYTTVKRMLDKCPDTAETCTTAEGKKYSPLDLHENYKLNVVCTGMSSEDDEEWKHIRELLFAFSPLMDGHRHLSDILTQSVRVVRAEIGHAVFTEGEKSFHWTVEQELKNFKELPPIEASDTFTGIEVPDIDHGGRPLSKKAIARSRNAAPTPKSKKPSKKSRRQKLPTIQASGSSGSRSISRSNTNVSAQKKSIYDDDAMDTGYIVSSDGEQDDSMDYDDDYFSGPESVEEYLSDETDERFDSFDSEDDRGEPTLTTEESWSNVPPSASKDSANGMSQTDEAEEEEEEEEKKEDETPDSEATQMQSCGPQFSEVGMRLLTFFMLYCDEKNPSDNYASLAQNMLDEVSRTVVDQVISLPLPPYAAQYLDDEDAARMDSLTLREVASPKCRELIHKLFYFLGRFDFKSETGGILLNKTADSSSVQVRSTEWIFSTEEYNEAQELEPGVAEAQVWETGIIPQEEVGYMGATFKAMRRSICFLFTKNEQVYRNEVNSREALGVAVEGGTFSSRHIVPLISHFDATSLDRKQDRMYQSDCNNESFIMLDIFGQKGNAATGESICLADYPYALVYPYSNYGDLFDYFFRHGVDGIEETREICVQIGRSLSSMHEQGIIHGNVSMRNIVLFPPQEDVEVEEGRKHWALTNLAGACRLQDSNSYMGKVSEQGKAGFFSSSLPPEMFVKLTSEELKAYKEYWDFVETEFGADVDRSVIEPVVDFQSGASYVMRCHFDASDESCDTSEKTLPTLPYKLLPARESADIWSFGQLLFMLCSSGRPLFPTNARTGSLLNYKEICTWDMHAAEAMIYEHVEHPLAQDILLRLLAPYEKRNSLSMETLLNHPFFNDWEMTSNVSRAIAEKRHQASFSFRRWLENKVTEKSEEGLLQERTVSISCWDFDFQTRIHLTPTALLPEFLSVSREQAGMPCSFLVLPYKLVRNKKGVLTPPSKRDVERAERLGLRMLSLSKACHFVNAIKRVVTGVKQPKGWSFSKVFSGMDLSKEDFHGYELRFSQLGTEHVELLRTEPMKVGLKLIQEEVRDLLACYEDSSKVSLFLVDEYKGVPTVSPSSAPFPHLVQSSQRLELARHGLPFMYLCARYFRAISGVPGFVRLIFEAAAPHVPPSWQPVCKGLDNSLNHQAIVDDMTILCEAMVAQSNVSIDDSFDFMHRYIGEVDPRRMCANMKRVSCGEAAVWTGAEGVQEIQEATKGYGFKEAIQTKLKTDQLLTSQEARIKELEKELAKLRFRQDLSLNVPDVDAPADFYQMEANVDIITTRTACNTGTPNAQASETIELVASDGMGNGNGHTSDTEGSFATPEGSLCEVEKQTDVGNGALEQHLEENPPAFPDDTQVTEQKPSYRNRMDRKWKILGTRGNASRSQANQGASMSVPSTPRQLEVQHTSMSAPSTPTRQQAAQKPAQSSASMSVPSTPIGQQSPRQASSGAPVTPGQQAPRTGQAGASMLPPTTPRQQATPRQAHPSVSMPVPTTPTSRQQASPSTPGQQTLTRQPQTSASTPVPSTPSQAQNSTPGSFSSTPRLFKLAPPGHAHNGMPATSLPSPPIQNPMSAGSPSKKPHSPASANALLNYLQGDDVSQPKNNIVTTETTVVESDQDFGDSLLENVSFECIDVEKRQMTPKAMNTSQNQYISAPSPSAFDLISEELEQALDMSLGPSTPVHTQINTMTFQHERTEVQQPSQPALQFPALIQESIQHQKEKKGQQQQQEPSAQTQQPPLQYAQQPHVVPTQQPASNAQAASLQLPTSKQQEPQVGGLAALTQQVLQYEPPKAQQIPQQEPQHEASSNEVGNLPQLSIQVPEVQPVLKTKVDSSFNRHNDGAEEAKSLLDDMFAEAADLVFAPTPKSTQSSPRHASPRHVARTVPPSSSSAVTPQETRDEDGRESSTITTDEANHGGTEENSAYLEVTHKELSELKQTLIAGRAAAKESRADPGESITDMFQKEMDIFQTEMKGLVGRNRNKFGSPATSREPSEVSGSMGNSSIEAGSVKRLTSFFLSGGSKNQEKPTIDVNTTNGRPLLSSPQSRLRRAALESKF